MHLPVEPDDVAPSYLQWSPDAQLTAVPSTSPHVSPSPARRTRTHFGAVVPPDVELPTQRAPETHPPSGHSSPTCFTGAHFPQVVGTCELESRRHWPLTHCVSSEHTAPASSEPRTSSRSSSHAS